MSVFDNDPARNQSGKATDPHVVAVTDQNKQAAIDLLKTARNFIVAVPSEDETDLITIAAGDLHFFEQVMDSLDEMLEQAEQELAS